MAGFDFSPYAVGGATRPDSFSGLNERFAASLAQMFQSAPPEIQHQLRIMSGYRSPERQKQLWEGALAKYGSPEAARKWVAPPGHSQHNMGFAADLKYLDPAATSWAHENAAKFGLNFPLGNEDWHIEPIGARSGKSGGMMALVDGHHGIHAPGPQAPGTPAPPMGAPIQVGDAPIAGAPPAEGASPLGNMLASFAQGMIGGGGGSGQSADAGQPRVLQEGGFGATNAAAQGAEQAKQLAFSMSPDIEKMLALAPKPFAKKPAQPMMVG